MDKILKPTKCEECGAKIEVAVLLEYRRRAFDSFIICPKCLNAAIKMLEGNCSGRDDE